MKYLDEIYWLISTLKIVSKDIIADWVAFKGWYTAGQSAYVNADKRCKRLSDEGKIVGGDKFWKLPHIKSEYKEHSKTLTEHLYQILKLPFQSVIHRELLLPDVGLRPDALILLKNGTLGRCIVLEVKVDEPETYFNQKVSAWKSWGGGKKALSELFGYEIPYVEMVTNENFNQFIRGL